MSRIVTRAASLVDFLQAPKGPTIIDFLQAQEEARSARQEAFVKGLTEKEGVRVLSQTVLPSGQTRILMSFAG